MIIKPKSVFLEFIETPSPQQLGSEGFLLIFYSSFIFLFLLLGYPVLNELEGGLFCFEYQWKLELSPHELAEMSTTRDGMFLEKGDKVS